MGGLKKQSLVNTLTKAGLRDIEIQIVSGIKCWYHQEFIVNHCAQETLDQLKAGTLPTMEVDGLTLYFIAIDLVLAVGKK